MRTKVSISLRTLKCFHTAALQFGYLIRRQRSDQSVFCCGRVANQKQRWQYQTLGFDILDRQLKKNK